MFAPVWYNGAFLLGEVYVFNFLFEKSSTELESDKTVITDSIGTYLINLDKAKERFNFVKDNIEKVGFPFYRISAVDGNLLSNEEIQVISDVNRYKSYFKMFPEKGTIGCSLSHKKAWEEFLKSDYEFALIFEDDVIFNPNELRSSVDAAIKNKRLWDILSFEILHNGFPLKVANLYENKFLSVYLTNITHSGCYILNRKAAKQYLQKLFPIFMGLDHYITASWEFDIKFLGVEPRIVRQNFGNSQIKTSESRKFNDIKTKLSNALYSIERAIVHFIYNSYVYLKIR